MRLLLPRFGGLRRQPVLVLCWIFWCVLLVGPSAAGPASSSSNARDKFVEASPLILALACRDGVALIAAHTADVPLLYDDDDIDDNKQEDGAFFRDLPETFGGPFRLQTIAGGGNTGSSTSSCASAMLTAGWRSDAARLVDAARSIDREYRETLGESSPTPYTLASNLSRYMAICAGTDGVCYLFYVCFVARQSILTSCCIFPFSHPPASCRQLCSTYGFWNQQCEMPRWRSPLVG